jgi:hypothetical protein
MKSLARLGWVVALAVAVLAYPSVWLLSLGATDAYLIAAKSPQMVQANQALADPRDPKESDASYHKKVMEIYGNAVDYKTSVVFVPTEKFIHPKEAPELVLLPVDKEKGENPLQVKSLYFFAKYAVMGSGAAFGVLLVLYLVLGKSDRKPASGPAQ